MIHWKVKEIPHRNGPTISKHTFSLNMLLHHQLQVRHYHCISTVSFIIIADVLALLFV